MEKISKTIVMSISSTEFFLFLAIYARAEGKSGRKAVIICI